MLPLAFMMLYGIIKLLEWAMIRCQNIHWPRNEVKDS